MNRTNTAKRKQAAINAFGGACQRCGYAKCMRALHFHHVTERTDKPGRANMAEVEAHPERFLVLCANCHIEEHDRLDRAAAVMAVCAYCGNPFRTNAHRLATRRSRFCSRKCQHAGVSAERSLPLSERFDRHVRPEGDCRIWTGAAYSGVPVLQFRSTESGKFSPHSARRIAWLLEHGAFPRDRLSVTCGNELCVNVDHFCPDRRPNASVR